MIDALMYGDALWAVMVENWFQCPAMAPSPGESNVATVAEGFLGTHRHRRITNLAWDRTPSLKHEHDERSGSDRLVSKFLDAHTCFDVF